MADARDRLTRLVGAEAAGLLAYFVRRVPNREDAADLLGETLLALARRPDRIPDDPEGARRWAFGVARTVLRAGRRTFSIRTARDAAAAEQLRDAALLSIREIGGPEDTEQRAVREAVRTLPERDRELLMLVHWEGFSIEEAAALLGMPSSSARTRLARARQSLAARLDVSDRVQAVQT